MASSSSSSGERPTNVEAVPRESPATRSTFASTRALIRRSCSSMDKRIASASAASAIASRGAGAHSCEAASAARSCSSSLGGRGASHAAHAAAPPSFCSVQRGQTHAAGGGASCPWAGGNCTWILMPGPYPTGTVHSTIPPYGEVTRKRMPACTPGGMTASIRCAPALGGLMRWAGAQEGRVAGKLGKGSNPRGVSHIWQRSPASSFSNVHAEQAHTI
mmetsp:Transcript_8162/g.17026  ORF Transcript_8162/g.17026 Transcript_8162/m.17026 type:complete len:218 (+) Transcript_8162:847-1500(+)